MTPPSALRFEVTAADAKDRLDKLIVKLLDRAGAPASRAAVQRWITNGRVLVGGAPAKPSQAVAPGAVLDVSPEPPEASSAAPDPSIALHVVHEDPHLIVIDK